MIVGVVGGIAIMVLVGFFLERQLTQSSSSSGSRATTGASGGGSVGTSGSTDTTPGTMTTAQYVSAERRLLTRSVSARAAVNTALNTPDATAGIAAVKHAIAERRALIRTANGWALVGAPAQARAAFVQALQASIDSDQIYLQALIDEAGGGTGEAAMGEAKAHDDQVTNPAKAEATRAYDALCAQIGAPGGPASDQW